MAGKQKTTATVWIRDGATELGGVADHSIVENIDTHSYQVDMLIHEAANYGLVQEGEWIKVRQVIGATTIDNEFYVEEVTEDSVQRGDGGSQRWKSIKARSQVIESFEPRIRTSYPKPGVSTATEIVQDAWTNYGPGGIDTATHVDNCADLLHITVSGWTLKRVMDEMCMRTGWVWWLEGNDLYFTDPAGAAVEVADANVRDGTWKEKVDESARVFAVEVPSRYTISYVYGPDGEVIGWFNRQQIVRREMESYSSASGRTVRIVRRPWPSATEAEEIAQGYLDRRGHAAQSFWFEYLGTAIPLLGRNVHITAAGHDTQVAVVERRRTLGPDGWLTLEIMAGDPPLDDAAVIGNILERLENLEDEDFIPDLGEPDEDSSPQISNVHVTGPWTCGNFYEVTWDYAAGAAGECSKVALRVVYDVDPVENTSRSWPLVMDVSAEDGKATVEAPDIGGPFDDAFIRVFCEDDESIEAFSDTFIISCVSSPRIEIVRTDREFYACGEHITVTWEFTPASDPNKCPHVVIRMSYDPLDYRSPYGPNYVTLASGVSAAAETWTGTMPLISEGEWGGRINVGCADSSAGGGSDPFRVSCGRLTGVPAPLAMILEGNYAPGGIATARRMVGGLCEDSVPSLCGPVFQVWPVPFAAPLLTYDYGFLTIDCIGEMHFRKVGACMGGTPPPTPPPTPPGTPTGWPTPPGPDDCCVPYRCIYDQFAWESEYIHDYCVYTGGWENCKFGYCSYKRMGYQGRCNPGFIEFQYWGDDCEAGTPTPTPTPSGEDSLADNFNRPDETPLAYPWILDIFNGTEKINLVSNRTQIQSVVASWFDCFAWQDTPLSTDDHYSEIDAAEAGGTKRRVWVLCRLLNRGTCYGAEQHSAADYRVRIFKRLSGVHTTIAQGVPEAGMGRIKCSIVGTTLKGYLGGVEKISSDPELEISGYKRVGFSLGAYGNGGASRAFGDTWAAAVI